ncbi:LysR family transcriptional regulator [Streptomyces sp. NPDC059883]|uniref:LysR family transcriptional regulator n=1 Tax=unclassified Streptomyces TaxID=2593676 RepID=UPI00365F322F
MALDLDLRKLRYFVAVAEELHFGRAAERLHIAQPVLSRQIKALESELKVQLFARDKRATELTSAGRQLLSDAVPLLASAEATRRRLARAAGGTETFAIGFMPGLIVTGAVRELSRRYPHLSVEVVRTGWSDQTEVIHDGRVDVGYVRMPLDRHGLRTRNLLTEPRVAVLPADHPYAHKGVLSVNDLADEHLLQDPDAVPEWRDIATELSAEAPADRQRTPPPTLTVEEKLENVAAGRGVVILPLSTASYYTRPDVTHVEISDIAPSQVCLAWASSRRSPLIHEFAAIAAEHDATGHDATGHDATGHRQ